MNILKRAIAICAIAVTFSTTTLADTKSIDKSSFISQEILDENMGYLYSAILASIIESNIFGYRKSFNQNFDEVARRIAENIPSSDDIKKEYRANKLYLVSKTVGMMHKQKSALTNNTVKNIADMIAINFFDEMAFYSMAYNNAVIYASNGEDFIFSKEPLQLNQADVKKAEDYLQSLSFTFTEVEYLLALIGSDLEKYSKVYSTQEFLNSAKKRINLQQLNPRMVAVITSYIGLDLETTYQTTPNLSTKLKKSSIARSAKYQKNLDSLIPAKK